MHSIKMANSLENIKLLLDDTEDFDREVGLLRLAKPLPDHEFFFHVNRLNSFCFERKEDLHIRKQYYQYEHSYFYGFCRAVKTSFHIFSNKSIQSLQIRTSTELFSQEDEIGFLLPDAPDVDYVVAASQPDADFSLILLPEQLTFVLQQWSLPTTDDLYHILRHYE